MHSTDRRAAVLALAAAVTVGLAVGGCGTAPASSLANASPSAADPRPTTTEPTASPGPVLSASPATLVDDALLSVLPDSVDGVALRSSADVASGMTSDPALARSARAVAVGVAVRPDDTTGDDLVVATVVRLRPGVWSDAFFRAWRADYDAAACAQAGGVERTGERVLGPRTVDTADCSGGARTYHAHLAGDLIVSATAVGAGGYGDLVMAGLRE